MIEKKILMDTKVGAKTLAELWECKTDKGYNYIVRTYSGITGIVGIVKPFHYYGDAHNFYDEASKVALHEYNVHQYNRNYQIKK